MTLCMQLAASTREHRKIPPYGLFYFPIDGALEPVPTTKVSGETPLGTVKTGMMVYIKCKGKCVPAKIIGLGGKLYKYCCLTF